MIGGGGGGGSGAISQNYLTNQYCGGGGAGGAGGQYIDRVAIKGGDTININVGSGGIGGNSVGGQQSGRAGTAGENTTLVVRGNTYVAGGGGAGGEGRLASGFNLNCYGGVGGIGGTGNGNGGSSGIINYGSGGAGGNGTNGGGGGGGAGGGFRIGIVGVGGNGGAGGYIGGSSGGGAASSIGQVSNSGSIGISIPLVISGYGTLIRTSGKGSNGRTGIFTVDGESGIGYGAAGGGSGGCVGIDLSDVSGQGGYGVGGIVVIGYRSIPDIINLQSRLYRFTIKLGWEFPEVWTQPVFGERKYVHIYKKFNEDDYTLVETLSKDTLTWTDYDRNINGIHYYAVIVEYIDGTLSMPIFTNIYADEISPQIEFAGRGGFNGLRHAIYTTHNATDGDRSTMVIKLWNGESTDASALETISDPDIILVGDKKIESKNIEPFTTDSIITGSELSSWKRIYSEISKTDKNVSARIRLKNGR
jgi:hypothetical protein